MQLTTFMWSETVDLRTRPVSDQKVGLGLSLGLAGLVLCCETWSCYARRHNDIEGHNDFSSTINRFFYSVIGASLLWRSIVAFTYLKVKSAKCLCLLSVVLVLRIFFSFTSLTQDVCMCVCVCVCVCAEEGGFGSHAMPTTTIIMCTQKALTVQNVRSLRKCRRVRRRNCHHRLHRKHVTLPTATRDTIITRTSTAGIDPASPRAATSSKYTCCI